MQLCSSANAPVHQPAESCNTFATLNAATLLRHLCAGSHSWHSHVDSLCTPASMSLKSAGLVWIIGNASVVASATCSQRQPVSDAMLLPCRHTQGDQPCSKCETELQLANLPAAVLADGLDFADPSPWNCTCSTKGCAKQCDKCTAVLDSIHVSCQCSPGYNKFVWYLHEQLWPLLAVAVVCATL